MKHNELIERLERESGAGWTDGHFGWLADAAVALRELQAERDKYRESLLSKHGRESLIGMALLDELDEGRAERDALQQQVDALRPVAESAKEFVRESYLAAAIRAMKI
jgi:hypothetical protein